MMVRRVPFARCGHRRLAGRLYTPDGTAFAAMA